MSRANVSKGVFVLMKVKRIWFISLLLHLGLVLTVFFSSSSFALSKDIVLLSDIAYGELEKQRLDVYYPAVKKQAAPVIFMVHGGAWRLGDKASKAVVKNKVAHWVSKGFIFISVNYRMLPEAQPLEQAQDVEMAIRFSQQHAYKWGGSAEKFILMGHSAGAHLVSLISARQNDDITPWLGTVSLDSAAYDVEKIMNSDNIPSFYEKAFGFSSVYWMTASPSHALSKTMPPFLAVCSTSRKDDACLQAKTFVEKALQYGTDAQVLPVTFSHRKINVKLGADYCYTRDVDAFIKTLHPSVEALLSSEQRPQRWSTKQQRCVDG